MKNKPFQDPQGSTWQIKMTSKFITMAAMYRYPCRIGCFHHVSGVMTHPKAHLRTEYTSKPYSPGKPPGFFPSLNSWIILPFFKLYPKMCYSQWQRTHSKTLYIHPSSVQFCCAINALSPFTHLWILSLTVKRNWGLGSISFRDLASPHIWQQ